MKYSQLVKISLLLVALASSVQALKCGTAFTEPCLGEKDKRYDESASIELKDQSEIWSKLEGLWEDTRYSYLPNYQPKEIDDIFGLFKLFPYTGFQNLTFDGSRGYRHTILLSAHKDGPTNNGLATYADVFATSTHEKDGSAITLPLQSEDFVEGTSERESISYPVGDDTMFGTVYGGIGAEEEKLVESITCLNDACTNASFVVERFEGGERIVYNTGTMRKLSKDEWITRIHEAYNITNIHESMRREIPMTEPCLSVNCPNGEDFWCIGGDPSCSKSPYEEPDGKLKPGIVAAIVVIGACFAAVVFFLVQRYSLRQQEKRYRTTFARRVADTMTIRKSMRSLTPDLLAKEFQVIDKQHDGRISKEELWEFLNTGKAGEINERDFNALFTCMDTTDSGSVDFLEFCAFLADCHDEYDKARQNRGSMAQRASRRLSQADFVARKSLADVSAKLLIDASQLDMLPVSSDDEPNKNATMEGFDSEHDSNHLENVELGNASSPEPNE